MLVLERLKRRQDFLRVTRAKRSAGMPGLVLQACPLPHPADQQPADHLRADQRQNSLRTSGPENSDAGDGNGARIGFTASRKVGNAVARNRAKRRLRALATEVLTRHACPGQDYVLIARQSTPTRPYAALRGDLERALKRLKLWRDSPPDADRRPE